MTNCCWNMANVPNEGHNDDCLTTFGPLHVPATMAVTFTDGVTTIYKNVRVCVNMPGHDGITVDGTTIVFETEDDTVFHLCGVRQFVYECDL
jgi:hypothetical protein